MLSNTVKIRFPCKAKVGQVCLDNFLSLGFFNCGTKSPCVQDPYGLLHLSSPGLEGQGELRWRWRSYFLLFLCLWCRSLVSSVRIHEIVTSYLVSFQVGYKLRLLTGLDNFRWNFFFDSCIRSSYLISKYLVHFWILYSYWFQIEFFCGQRTYCVRFQSFKSIEAYFMSQHIVSKWMFHVHRERYILHMNRYMFVVFIVNRSD